MTTGNGKSDFPNKGGSFSSLKCPKKVALTLFFCYR